MSSLIHRAEVSFFLLIYYVPKVSMPREKKFNFSKADLEKLNICEFADLVSLFTSMLC